MRVSRPRSTDRRQQGVFRIDAAALEQLDAYVRAQYAVTELTAEYTLKAKDGTGYHADDRSSVEKLPFGIKRNRDEFAIIYRRHDDNTFYHDELASIHIRFWRPTWISISAWSEDRSRELADGISSLFDGYRVWYSWLYSQQFGTITTLIPAIFIGFTFPDAMIDIFRKKPNHIVIEPILLLCWSIAAQILVILFHLFKPLLFDTVIMDFGHEAEKQIRLQTARKWIFGTIAGGILLALLTRISSQFLPGK